MGVDGNFKRLEDEVERLIGVLERLKNENDSLMARVKILEAEGAEVTELRRRLAEADSKYTRAAEEREEAKVKIEAILSRLDQIPL